MYAPLLFHTRPLRHLPSSLHAATAGIIYLLLACADLAPVFSLVICSADVNFRIDNEALKAAHSAFAE